MRYVNMAKCALLALLLVYTWIEAVSQDSVLVLQREYYLDRSTSDVKEKYVTNSYVITDKEQIALLNDEFSHVFTQSELMNHYGINNHLICSVANSFLQICNPVYLSIYSWNMSQINYMRQQITDNSVIMGYLQDLLNPVYDRGYGHQWHRYEYAVKLNGESYTSRKHFYSSGIPYTDSKGRVYYAEKSDSLISYLFHRPVKHVKRGPDLFRLILDELMRDSDKTLNELEKETYSSDLERLGEEFDVTWLGGCKYPVELEFGFDSLYHYWKCVGLTNAKLPRQLSFRYYAGSHEGHLVGLDSILNRYTSLSHQVAGIPFIKEYLANDTSARITIMFYNGSTINKGLMDEINGDAKHWKLQDDYIRALSEYELSEQNRLLSYEVNCGCNYRFDDDFLSQSIFFRVESEHNTSAYCLLLPDGTVLVTHISYKYEKNSPAMLFNRPLHYYGSNLDTMLFCVRLNSQGAVLSVRNSTD